jgi:hypothetical protein
MVLVDGFRDRLSQGEAEEKIHALAAMYKPVLIGVEKLGKGYDFTFGLAMNTALPIVPCPREGEGKRSKGQRFEGSYGLGPLFQFSRAWISDLDTPFLKAFRAEWAQWPNGKHDDTLDAVYWMLYVSQGLLIPAQESEFIGQFTPKKKSGFASMAKHLEGRR